MRAGAAAGEAGRNLGAGVTAWWLVVPMFVLLVGGPVLGRVGAAKDTFETVDRNAAAGVDAVEVRGVVDGARCESLAISDRYTASGALRPADPLTLTVEPRSPVTRMQLTAGAAAMFGVTADAATQPGVHLSSALDAELGHPRDLRLSSGATLDVVGRFEPPDELTDFDRLVVEVVPALGPFERCLVDRALALPGDAQDVARVVDRQAIDGMTIVQVNSDYGEPIDGRLVLDDRLGGVGRWAPVAGAALVAVFAVRLRRREIALLRHLGAPRRAVAVTHAVEALAWSVVGAAVVLAGAVVVATRDTSSAQAGYLLRLAAAGVGAGVLGAALVAAAMAAAVRAGAVLRYLNDAG